jgi:hypothetical protein
MAVRSIPIRIAVMFRSLDPVVLMWLTVWPVSPMPGLIVGVGLGLSAIRCILLPWFHILAAIWPVLRAVVVILRLLVRPSAGPKLAELTQGQQQNMCRFTAAAQVSTARWELRLLVCIAYRRKKNIEWLNTALQHIGETCTRLGAQMLAC